jgi:hypothetical protein
VALQISTQACPLGEANQCEIAGAIEAKTVAHKASHATPCRRLTVIRIACLSFRSGDQPSSIYAKAA